MKNILLIVLIMVSTLMASQPIMSVLEEVIVPHGHQMIAMSPVELRTEVLGFSLAIGASISLVIGVAGYIQWYSLPVRLIFVLLPILVGSMVSGFFLAEQLMQATSLSEGGNLVPAIALKQLNLDQIPWAGFITGLFAMGMMLWFGKRRANTDTHSRDATAN